jgi:thiamine pyrophosphokinase
MPRAIVGDLDSLRDDVRSYFMDKGVIIEEQSDQYSTDFMKCLKFAQKLRESERRQAASASLPELDIIAFGSLGGRADQAFAEIHQLYLASQDRQLVEGRLFFLTSRSLLFVLHKGQNELQALGSSRFFGESAGIIPIGRPAVISTKGFEWDVRDWPTDFEGQMSTSNYVRSDDVSVETDTRILFSIELGITPHP